MYIETQCVFYTVYALFICINVIFSRALAYTVQVYRNVHTHTRARAPASGYLPTIAPNYARNFHSDGINIARFAVIVSHQSPSNAFKNLLNIYEIISNCIFRLRRHFGKTLIFQTREYWISKRFVSPLVPGRIPRRRPRALCREWLARKRDNDK